MGIFRKRKKITPESTKLFKKFARDPKPLTKREFRKRSKAVRKLMR